LKHRSRNWEIAKRVIPICFASHQANVSWNSDFFQSTVANKGKLIPSGLKIYVEKLLGSVQKLRIFLLKIAFLELLGNWWGFNRVNFWFLGTIQIIS
jgi:hypothetical protein